MSAVRLVPLRLDDYIAMRTARPVKPGQECTGCFEGTAIADDGANAYCDRCWSRNHEFDRVEETTVRTIVGAAVAAALAVEASEELVRAAVEDALAGHIDVRLPGEQA